MSVNVHMLNQMHFSMGYSTSKNVMVTVTIIENTFFLTNNFKFINKWYFINEYFL